MTAPLLQVTDLRKSFGGSQALRGTTLTVGEGEIHGLLGANGSGKSTLIKVLAGYHDVDAGDVALHGRPVPLPLGAGRPQQLGLAFVHQDLGLVPSVSALENYLLGSLATSRGSFRISWRTARRQMRTTLERYGIDIDPRALVADLRPVERALLAIVRALESPGVEVSAERRLVVLDEPTVFLPQQEVSRLFDLMRRVAADGSSVLFVSHDLDEVREITDQVTVLRNGAAVLSGATRELSADQLIQAIVGAKVATALPEPARRAESGAAGTVELRGLRAGSLGEVSFTARNGEIVGLTGLIGSGYEDVVRALGGAIPATAGSIRVGDSEVLLSAWSAQRANANGVVLVPGDRLRESAIADLPITDNVTMVNLRSYMRGGTLRRKSMLTRARQLADAFDVRPPDARALFGTLSGGNQQKVVLAKWLQTGPRLLLLHEPTQGVDVGARQQIFQTIRAGAGDRVTLCASSDHDQLAQLCDRVLVLRRGDVAAELTGAEVTKQRITEECLRGGPERTGSQ